MNTSELTLLVLRIEFLLLIWLFVFAIVYALRTDLFGQRVRKLPQDVAASPFTEHPGSTPGRTPGRAGSPLRPAAPTPAAAATSDCDPAADSLLQRRRLQLEPIATVFTAGHLVITSGPKQGTELALGRDR